MNFIKNTKFAFIPLVGLLGLSSCSVGHPTGIGPYGALLTYTTVGLSGDSVRDDYKSGRECTYGILNIFTFGNARLNEAAGENGINRIHSVSRSHFSVLGNLYSQTCTNIRGEHLSNIPEYKPDPSEASREEQSRPSANTENFNDVVVLKDGRKFENVKAAVTRDSVVIVTRDGKSMVFPKTQVKAFKKGR